MTNSKIAGWPPKIVLRRWPPSKDDASVRFQKENERKRLLLTLCGTRPVWPLLRRSNAKSGSRAMATSRLVVVRCLSKPTLQDNPITLVVNSRVAYKVSEQQRK